MAKWLACLIANRNLLPLREKSTICLVLIEQPLSFAF